MNIFDILNLLIIAGNAAFSYKKHKKNGSCCKDCNDCGSSCCKR